MKIFRSLFKDEFSENYKLNAKLELATDALKIMARFAKELADIDKKAGEESRSECLYSMHKNAMEVIEKLES